MNKETLAKEILSAMGGKVAINGVIKTGAEAERLIAELPQADFDSLVADYRLLTSDPYWSENWSTFEP